MRLEFHPEALTEYRAAVAYYESRKPKLGVRFAEAIEDAIRRISESPLAGRILDDDIRRCLTRVFPYGVLYTIEDDLSLAGAVIVATRDRPGADEFRPKRPRPDGLPRHHPHRD